MFNTVKNVNSLQSLPKYIKITKNFIYDST